MEYRDIQRRVTACIWSEKTRREIENRGIVYSPMALLRIVMDAEQAHAGRQALYALLAENLPEIAAAARKQAAREQEDLAWFCGGGPGIVYALSATDSRCSEPPGELLCASWEAVLSQAERYREFYRPFFGKGSLTFTVTKRPLLQTDTDWEHEAEGWCDLDDALRVQRVRRWRADDCHGDCDDCPEECVHREPAVYPLCLAPWGFVRYRWGGWENYAVCWLTGHEEAMEHDAALIPLDDTHMADRDEDGFYGHIHVPLADVEPVTAQELPEELRTAAVEFQAWLMRKSRAE